MKITIVHSRYRSAAPSGENIVVDQEAEALLAAGHDVELFQRDSDDIAQWSLPRQATLPARSVWSREAKRELIRLLEVSRPDVVHVHNTFPMLSPSVLHACREAEVPVVVTIHNYRLLCAGGGFFRDGEPCHDCATGWGAPALRHGCYRSSRLATAPIVVANLLHRPAWQELVSAYIFISESQKTLMAPLGVPEDRTFVKHNFVDGGDLRAGPPEHLVTYVGRLDAAKGIDLLMRAWDTFLASRPDTDLRLVVVGGGPLEREVRDWAAGRRSVELAGLVTRRQVGSLLARSVASVVTSRSEETFGLVAVEAMAAGVAPIAPDMGPFPELITHEADGVLFDAADTDSLASRLLEVDCEPERFVTMGRQGRLTYERRFQSASSVDRLLEIYRFAIDNPAVPASSDHRVRPRPVVPVGRAPLDPVPRRNS